MKLPKNETDRFYRLFRNVCQFVNENEKIYPGLDDLRTAEFLNQDVMYVLSEDFFSSPELIDEYVRSNPDHLAEEELEIVESWKTNIHDRFLIERILKKGAMLIGSNEMVYQMVGLVSDPEELFGNRPLPVMIETTLIPYKGKIIYPSVLSVMPVTFGPGIRANLKEIYLDAKNHGEIITNLD